MYSRRGRHSRTGSGESLSEADDCLRYARRQSTGLLFMRSFSLKKFLLFSLSALLLTACAALRPVTTPVSENPAVLTLVEQARAEAAENKLNSAIATIERAQRLEPRNPWLWQELARLYLAQGNNAQAESLAARSNTWAGSDWTLRATNWRLISAARAARGDTAGAQEAEARAAKLERR